MLFPSMHQDNCGYLCMIIQPALKEDAGWYTVSAKNDAGIVSSTARLDVHSRFQLLTGSNVFSMFSSPQHLTLHFLLSSVAAAKPSEAQEGPSLSQPLRRTDGERAGCEGSLLS
ncbi:hypothetical protein XENOCAPTIV_017774 [Xenoophorus captivus]|uniref:Immunoglobulin I-set domain-containing protein n=1 Tax=Xenoophorus captivus TaxID=1517983 RepID=A0ABV0QAL0_9TELE